MKIVAAVIAIAFAAVSAFAVDARPVAPNSTVFIGEMGGFGAYVTAAITKKKVPLTIVTDKAKADFEITGNAESEKAGWARTIFTGQSRSNEQASINLVNLKTSAVIFGYAVNKTNSVHGKQSAAEAFAKHLKEAIAK